MISLVSRTFAAATTLAPVNTQALSYNGNVSGQRDAALDQINAKNAAQFIENPSAKMPKLFPTPLDAQAVQDVAAYVQGLK